MQADIIIPVWNKPIETRNCLVSLVAHTPGCRLIMVDNGSDRETRIILQETAEYLNDRALLLCRGRNDGFIGSVNCGLEKAAAAWIAVVKPTSIVTPGWFSPLEQAALQHPDAVILVPGLVRAGDARQKLRSQLPLETEPHSFHAILFRKDFIKAAGPLDQNLGDSHWCAEDMCRRAYCQGHRSLLVPDSVVTYADEPVFGSAARREAREANSRTVFDSRWGLRRSYCIYFPKEVDIAEIGRKLDMILTAARQGDRFVILLHNRHYRKLAAAGQVLLHTSISMLSLPRFSVGDAALKLWRRVREEHKDIEPVTGGDGLSFPGGEAASSFSQLAAQVTLREKALYGRETHAE